MSLDSVYSFHILLISRQKANTIHTLIIKDSHNTSLCLVCIISSLIITLSKFLFDLFSWYLNKCVDIFGPPVDWILPVVITPCDNILMYYTEISFMSSCDIWRLDPGLWSIKPSLFCFRMGKTIQGWTRMENRNLSADLAQSLSSSLRTDHPPSSLHPSTPASPPTRATCAHLSACRTTPSPCPRTRLHPSCLRCARARGSTSPPSWPTLL